MAELAGGTSSTAILTTHVGQALQPTTHHPQQLPARDAHASHAPAHADQPHSITALQQLHTPDPSQQQQQSAREADALDPDMQFHAQRSRHRLGHNPWLGTDHLQPEPEGPQPVLTWVHQAGAIFALFALYYAQPEHNGAQVRWC